MMQLTHELNIVSELTEDMYEWAWSSDLDIKGRTDIDMAYQRSVKPIPPGFRDQNGRESPWMNESKSAAEFRASTWCAEIPNPMEPALVITCKIIARIQESIYTI